MTVEAFARTQTHETVDPPAQFHSLPLSLPRTEGWSDSRLTNNLGRVAKNYFVTKTVSACVSQHGQQANRSRAARSWPRWTFQSPGRRQRKIYGRCRSHCVAIFTTCNRMLIMSKRCEKTFGFGKKMQRSGKSSPETSANFDHSSPIIFILDRKVSA